MNGISLLSDTNPLIYLFDGNRAVAKILDQKQVWISVITELELFGKKGLNSKDMAEISALLDSCFIAEINSDIKMLTKQLLQDYQIRLPDAIIAATSIYLDLPLLTADTTFKKVRDLKIILFEI
jgi:predicted nucleic acid-binding protein